ncbi:hypothetical protein pb186bvf_012490 [Paramecium bursaria]
MQKPNNLVIIIKSAQLHDRKGKKMHPSAELQLGSQRFQTPTLEGVSPKWDQKFELNYDDKNFNLQVQIYDTDPKSKQQDVIGSGIINLLKVVDDPDWEIKLPIYNKSKDEGSVELQFNFLNVKKPKSETTPKQSKLTLIPNRKIEFESVDYEGQLKDFEDEIEQLRTVEYFPLLQYMEETKLNEAIQKALNHVSEVKPKDQIECFAQYLLNN